MYFIDSDIVLRVKSSTFEDGGKYLNFEQRESGAGRSRWLNLSVRRFKHLVQLAKEIELCYGSRSSECWRIDDTIDVKTWGEGMVRFGKEPTDMIYQKKRIESFIKFSLKIPIFIGERKSMTDPLRSITIKRKTTG